MKPENVHNRQNRFISQAKFVRKIGGKNLAARFIVHTFGMSSWLMVVISFGNETGTTVPMTGTRR
jgi:hypothetical protein